MLETLRRMRDRDMATAIVCAEEHNPAAVRLYESVGFRIADTLCLYTRKV